MWCVDQHHLGTYQKCTILDPLLDLLKQTLQMILVQSSLRTVELGKLAPSSRTVSRLHSLGAVDSGDIVGDLVLAREKDNAEQSASFQV